MSTRKQSIQLMTEGSVAKCILTYTLPIFIGYLFQQLYNTIDALIVGNLVGQNALAAVTSVGSLTFLLVGFFTGFSTGASVIVAREIGANNKENTFEAVHTTVALGIVLGLLMTILGLGFSPWLLRVMGTPSDVLPLSQSYLTIYFAGSFSLIMYNMLVGILRAGGDSRHPLYYLMISSIVNVILDIFFISVFHMGVAGAALATIISETISMILSLYRLTHEESMIALQLKKIHFNPTVLKEILVYGFPTGLQGCVIDFANMLIQSYINSFGAAAVAGIGAYSRVEGFVFLPVTSFSMALTTYVSQNIGAQKPKRVKDGIIFGLITSTLVIELIGIIIYAFSPVFIRAFNQDPEVVSYGVLRARTTSLFYCLLGFSHITSSVQRGLGHPTVPMVVMLVCWCAVRVIVLLTIGQTIHDIRLTNWLYPLTWSLSAIYDIYWLYHCNSLKKA